MNYLSLFRQQVLCITLFAVSLLAHTCAYTNAILTVLEERFGVEKAS